MKHQCGCCKKTVDWFYSIRYIDNVGWCSEECSKKGKAIDKEEQKKKILEERMRIIQQSTRAPYFVKMEE
jgi:hypothetical protein